LTIINEGGRKCLPCFGLQSRYLDVELNNPDFLVLGSAFGIFGVRVRTAEEFAESIRKALASEKASIIEIVDDWRLHRF